ncbi:MAG: P-loop NTPase [Deltaproteobacteria bacterium]|nr:P-loop NTPase [Deltaproteobacteria bacterium]
MRKGDGVEQALELGTESRPVLWAVGGGKGGVGKSIVCSLLAFWLARLDKKVILVDLDLGGASLHTLMGIKTPPRTLNDFVSGRCKALGDVCIGLELENLRLICGASENLALANPEFAKKKKIIQNILSLDADYVILDLGAGTSFNVLDFFLVAHRKIAVLTPDPISVHNTYAFVRNAVYRKLGQVTKKTPYIHQLVQKAMDPKNDLNIQTVRELLEVIGESGGNGAMETLEREIRRIRPALITNMARDSRDKNMGNVVGGVAENYLMLEMTNLGGVAYDEKILQMVSGMIPLTRMGLSSEAFRNTYDIVAKLIRLN